MNEIQLHKPSNIIDTNVSAKMLKLRLMFNKAVSSYL